MSNSKNKLSGFFSATFSLLAFLTAIPTDLQAQILKVIPAAQAQYWAIGFAVAAWAVRQYKSANTVDTPPPPTNNP